MKTLTLILAMSSIVAYGQEDTTGKQPIIFGGNVTTIYLGKCDTAKRGLKRVIMPSYNTEYEKEDELTFKSHKSNVLINKTFSAYYCMKGNKQWYEIQLNDDNDLIYRCRINVYKTRVIFFEFINTINHSQLTELTDLIAECKKKLP